MRRVCDFAYHRYAELTNPRISYRQSNKKKICGELPYHQCGESATLLNTDTRSRRLSVSPNPLFANSTFRRLAVSPIWGASSPYIFSFKNFSQNCKGGPLLSSAMRYPATSATRKMRSAASFGRYQTYSALASASAPREK